MQSELCYLICSRDVDVVGPAPGSSPTRVGSNEVARQKSSSNTTCAKTTGWEGGKQSELARVKTHNSNSNVNKQTLLSGAPRGHSFTEGKKNIEECKYELEGPSAELTDKPRAGLFPRKSIFFCLVRHVDGKTVKGFLHPKRIPSRTFFLSFFPSE